MIQEEGIPVPMEGTCGQEEGALVPVNGMGVGQVEVMGVPEEGGAVSEALGHINESEEQNNMRMRGQSRCRI